MIKWFKKLFYIVKHFDDIHHTQSMINAQVDGALIEQHSLIKYFGNEVEAGVRTIKDRTELHVDVSPMNHGDPHQIILIGKYHNRDYIQTYSVAPEDFRHLIDVCKDMQRYARRGRIDAIPEMKAIINEESMKWWGE